MIEYVHIVAYFVRNPPAPFAAAAAIARTIELCVGEGRVSSLLLASPGTMPGPGWEERKYGEWAFTKKADRLDGVLTTVNDPATESRVWSTLFERQHNGAKRKLLDYDWAVVYDHENDFPQFQWDADLAITVRLDLLKNTGPRAARALVDDLVRLCIESGDVYYLLTDVAELGLTGADGVYHREGTPNVPPTSLARAVEKVLWQDLRQDRRDYVRGVFWGNYLGPRLMERLGGRDPFRERYLAHAKQHLRLWENLATNMPGGGLFVKISDDPMDESSVYNVAHLGMETAVWLHRELRRVGALL